MNAFANIMRVNIVSGFAITKDFIFFAIFTIAIFVINLWMGKKNKESPRRIDWVTTLSVIFGRLSVISLVGLILVAIFPSINESVRFPLAYLPIPGIVSGILAIVLGIIGYIKEKTKNAQWAITLGSIAIVIVFILLITAGGTPPLCASHDACHLLGDSSGCLSYFHVAQPDVLHPGLCAPPLSPGAQ